MIKIILQAFKDTVKETVIVGLYALGLTMIIMIFELWTIFLFAIGFIINLIGELREKKRSNSDGQN